MKLKSEILMLLEKNAKLSAKDIALRLDANIEEVDNIINELENDKIILGYNTVINWDMTDKEIVTALIEVRITPQRGQGFDRIAQRIYSFSEVKDCFLMSGGFDLLIVIEGKTLKEVAMFVSEKIAPLDSVISTETHFILKKYKANGTIYDSESVTSREAVVL
jgi:DNA-binding Lrp family transcriptional regulator